jgi:hypothetical protein
MENVHTEGLKSLMITVSVVLTKRDAKNSRGSWPAMCSPILHFFQQLTWEANIFLQA